MTKGCDLAFDTTVTVILEGELPEGGKDKVCKWIADFLEVTEKEDRNIVMRNAYEKITELLDTLGITSWD